ncbi:cytochrome P450 [Rhodococcoides fascians]|uniref:cytochrome P450 n=1 Tax=Rhodococcoides fascians TaxID=1828 RepID=UPI00068F7996|nr:cytochrome P450 [Rhodococcus fascians]
MTMPTLRSTQNSDPIPFYESLHEGGPVTWDDDMQAWLVSDFKTCKTLLRRDMKTIRQVDADDMTTMVAISGSARTVKYLEGEDHRRMHGWWLRAFNPERIDGYRTAFIRPLIDQTLDAIIEQGHAEMVSQFASKIPPRAVAAALDLPWQDDEWIERVQGLLNQTVKFFDQRFIQDDAVVEEAKAASSELNRILMPHVEERKSAQGNDLLSLLWRDGAEILDDWNETDVVGHIRNMFLGGTDTSTLAITNALYLLLRDPELKARIADGDADLMARFVEESLRLYGPVHFRPRKANEAFDLAGSSIEKDQILVPMLAAADRDPAQFTTPDSIDLDRKSPKDHLAFNFGPRTCVGAALARAEIQESIAAVLERLGDIRLDPDKDAPSLTGFTLRSWSPLNVIFTPGRRVLP